MRKRLLLISSLFTLLALLPCVANAAVRVFRDRTAWEAALQSTNAQIGTEDFADEPSVVKTPLPYLTAGGTLIANVRRASNIGVPDDSPQFDSRHLYIYETSGTIRVTLKEPAQAFGFDYLAVQDWILRTTDSSDEVLGKQLQPSFIGLIDDSSTFLSFELKLASPTFFTSQALAIDNLSLAVACGPCHDELLGRFQAVTDQLDTIQAAQETNFGALQAEMADLKAEVQDLAIVLDTITATVACESPRNSAVICPAALTSTRGSISSGNYTTLCASDNNHLIANSGGDGAVAWIADFQIGPDQVVCGTLLKIEGNVGLRRSDLQLRVYNWKTLGWDSIGFAPFPVPKSGDQTTTLAVGGPDYYKNGLLRIEVFLQRSGSKYHIATDSLQLHLRLP